MKRKVVLKNVIIKVVGSVEKSLKVVKTKKLKTITSPPSYFYEVIMPCYT